MKQHDGLAGSYSRYLFGANRLSLSKAEVGSELPGESAHKILKRCLAFGQLPAIIRAVRNAVLPQANRAPHLWSMDNSLTFSRYKLTTFLACQRRFQLRYVRELPWPAEPAGEAWRQASQRGRTFHRMLHRHFLDLPVEEPAGDDPTLRRWWRTFQERGPSLPSGERRPEETLTVPINDHLLSGRFDLVVLSGERAHIFDWKTEARPRSAAALRDDWQTILYLALLVEGGQALRPGGRPLDPEKVALTYWFVQAPQATITIPYGREAHVQNWQRLTDLVQRIDERLAGDGVWPLTDDWEECGRCAYQIFCGRQGAPPASRPSWEEGEDIGGVTALEPDLP